MKKLKIFCTFLVLAAILGSCSKNEVTPDSKHPQRLFSSIESNYANPLNQFDSSGIYHNELLAYYASKSPSASTTNQDFIDWTDEYFSNNDLIQNWADSIATTDVGDTLLALQDGLSTNYTSLYYASSDLTSKQNEYLVRISNLIANMKSKTGSSVSSVFSTAIDSIKLLENEVMNENPNIMPEADKEIVLRAASIARYSLHYWYTQSTTSGNAWGLTVISGDDNIEDLTDINWMDVGRSDVNGLVFGYVNSWWGAFFGPWGPTAVTLGTSAVFSAIAALS